MRARLFGHLPDGRPVHEFTLAAEQGLSLSAISYGGIVTRLTLPDADGQPVNVVLGFAGLDDYVQRNPHFGTIVGRYGNRIAGASFELDGQQHLLSANDGPNCLHGGAAGFGHQLWQVEPEGDDVLCLRLDSPHGDQGFPGRLQVTVRYRLVDALSWQIEYEAQTDRPTVLNLTHHNYFNLAGQGSALAHELQIPAQRYCEVDAHLIPRALAPVAGTPFDFRQPQVIAARLRQGHAQLGLAKGYDHNWLLDSPPDASGLRLAARLRDPGSGRVMDVLSTEPALQFYSGNFLDGSLLGSGGAYYRQGDGLCLETQHSPDSPHHDHSPDWPSTVLRPGQTYRSRTLHRFIIER